MAVALTECGAAIGNVQHHLDAGSQAKLPADFGWNDHTPTTGHFGTKCRHKCQRLSHQPNLPQSAYNV